MPPPGYRFRWYLYWLLVGLLQFILANLLAALAQILARADSATTAGLALTLAVTWGADSAVVFLLGWAALNIRRAALPWRLGTRLLLTALGVLLPLLLPLLLYDTAVSLRGVPLTDIAAALGILGFHLPGWLGPHGSSGST